MLYNIGDLFVVRGLDCKVVYINAGAAFVAPLEDVYFEGHSEFKGCAFERLDAKGVDRTGKRASSVVGSCGAV